MTLVLPTAQSPSLALNVQGLIHPTSCKPSLRGTSTGMGACTPRIFAPAPKGTGWRRINSGLWDETGTGD